MLAEIGDHFGRNRRISEIDNVDAEAMHVAITKSGRPIRANRIAAVGSKMFSLALKRRPTEDKPWRDATMGNPFKGLKRNQETQSERFCSTSEIAAISEALADYGNVSPQSESRRLAKAGADCIRLIMLTGCRPSEARLAAWKQFDDEPGFWIKRSAHVKQRKVHKLALSAAALELIDRLKARPITKR